MRATLGADRTGSGPEQPVARMMSKQPCSSTVTVWPSAPGAVPVPATHVRLGRSDEGRTAMVAGEPVNSSTGEATACGGPS